MLASYAGVGPDGPFDLLRESQTMMKTVNILTSELEAGMHFADSVAKSYRKLVKIEQGTKHVVLSFKQGNPVLWSKKTIPVLHRY